MDLGRNSYDIRTVRNCFRQSFLVLTEAHYDWDFNRFDRNRSILEYIIFPHDFLFRKRIKFPIRFSGTSDLEKTEWWRDVLRYFDQPIGAPRSPPILPKCIINQVRQDLEAVQPGGVQSCVDGLKHQLFRKPDKKRKRRQEEVSARPQKKQRREVEKNGNKSVNSDAPTSEPEQRKRKRPHDFHITEVGSALQSSESTSQIDILETRKQQKMDNWD